MQDKINVDHKMNTKRPYLMWPSARTAQEDEEENTKCVQYFDASITQSAVKPACHRLKTSMRCLYPSCRYL